MVVNMRVCLINPPRIQPKARGKPSVHQPMDLAYVALSEVKPLIETPEFTCEDLLMLPVEANMVNPTFTRDRVIRAMRDPKRAVKILFERKSRAGSKQSGKK